MEITYRPAGQKIMFFGADDSGKVKSIKVSFGYTGILHFEELDQFAGEEIRNLEQSVLRGGPFALEFKGQARTAYPPLHLSDHAYEHEYLGISNGTGGMVFGNVQRKPITEAEIAQFDRTYNGVERGIRHQKRIIIHTGEVKP